MHPVQRAFHQHHGLQCGFCTPGMVMAAADLIATYPGELDEQIVREEMEGNLCRCTGYHNIVKAILAAANEMRPPDAPRPEPERNICPCIHFTITAPRPFLKPSGFSPNVLILLSYPADTHCCRR